MSLDASFAPSLVSLTSHSMFLASSSGISILFRPWLLLLWIMYQTTSNLYVFSNPLMLVHKVITVMSLPTSASNISCLYPKPLIVDSSAALYSFLILLTRFFKFLNRNFIWNIFDWFLFPFTRPAFVALTPGLDLPYFPEALNVFDEYCAVYCQVAQATES